MAPLKFRCWDPTVKLTAVDITLEFLANLKGLAVPHLNVALQCASKMGLVIMQSTGLHDKNGREIFEGDILRYFNPNFPSDEDGRVGFRVAETPEPSTGVLAVIACGIMWWWRRRFTPRR